MKLQDPDLTYEDSLPLLAISGVAATCPEDRAGVSNETLAAVAQAATTHLIDGKDVLSANARLLHELQRWGILLGELQRRQEPGSAPANASAAYGELRLGALATLSLGSADVGDVLGPDSWVLVQALQSTVTHCLPVGDGFVEEESQGEGHGRQALLRGLIARPLQAMPATEGQRSALRSALFGLAPGLLVLEKLRTNVEHMVLALERPERSAHAEGQLDVHAAAGLSEEDSFWGSMSGAGLGNNLQQLLQGPAISASLSNPAMLDAFISSASHLREVLVRQKPGFGPNRPEGRDLDDNALRPFLEAASKALELRQASACREATICLDVALLAAVHSGDLRPCLEWLNFVTSGNIGSNFSLGPLTGCRLLELAARMCPVQFKLVENSAAQDPAHSRSFLSTAIPAAGLLGLALQIEVPQSGIELKVLRNLGLVESGGDQPIATDFGSFMQAWITDHGDDLGGTDNYGRSKKRKSSKAEAEADADGNLESSKAEASMQPSGCPFLSVQVADGRAILEPGGLAVKVVSRTVLAEFLLDFSKSQLHVFLNGKHAGRFSLPSEDIAIMLTYQLDAKEAAVAELQRWPLVLPLPESQLLANQLVPSATAEISGAPETLAAVVASHLRMMNLWHLRYSHGDDHYRVLQLVEVRDSTNDPWKPATVVETGIHATAIKVKCQPEDAARSWLSMRPWLPRICPGAGDTDRLVHLAHACLQSLSRSADGISAAPVMYHVARLLRIALQAESAGAATHVLKLVSGLLAWSQEDITDGVRILIASAALRLLAAVCPALPTQAALDVVDLLQAAVAMAPAVPAELWLLRSRLLQSCALRTLLSQLHQEGHWPALLRKLGAAAVRPGALSLCALLIRTSLMTAAGAGATAEAGDVDAHGLAAFLDHTTAAIISGVVTAKEPGVREDIPCCLLLASKVPALASKAATRAVALVGAVAKAGAPAAITLSLVHTACELCVKMIPEKEAAAPPPEVLRSLRCLPETTLESTALLSTSSLAMPQVEISGESLLREWLSDGSTSAMPNDPDADVAKLAAEIPGVLGARTRAVEVAVLRLLRCAAASAEQPDLAASQEAEQVRAAARRFLSEQQATAAGERERVVAEMGEISAWLAAHWVAHSHHAVQGPVKLIRARSSIVSATSSLSRTISNSQVLASKRGQITRSNSNLSRANSNLSDTNSNLVSPKSQNLGSWPLRKFTKSRSLELDLSHPNKDRDLADMVLRLRRAAGVAEAASSGSAALVELLFAPGQGKAKLHQLVAVTQRRWLRWIQVAALLEQLLEVFAAGEKASSAALAASSCTAAQGKPNVAAMARLQICETIAVLFSAWGSPAWFEEMPRPVAHSLLGSARRVLGAALSGEPPQNVAAFGELPLVSAAAVLGVPTPAPRALLSLACGDGAESCPAGVSTCLREAAWAAYLAAALLGPRAEAASQVQAAIRSLCNELSGGEAEDKALEAHKEVSAEGVEQSVGTFSTYMHGGNYSCEVKRIKIVKKTPLNLLELHIEAHGDGSIGPLQNAESSTVTSGTGFDVGFTFESWTPESSDAPLPDGVQQRLVGKLTYEFPLLCETESISFTFGQTGYSQTTISLPSAESAMKDATMSNALPSLATGKRPSSRDLALAELLVILRRLLDAAPSGSPPVLLDVPAELLKRPALKALTLTVLASAVRGGASPPPHINIALVPLSNTSPWEQLAAEQLVRIWQQLLIRASSSRENAEDFSSWRGSAAALVARLEWRRPELAVAALAVLGCRCEVSPLQAASKAAVADGWQPPPSLEWVEPLDDEPPETIQHLLPEERAALFGASLQLLQHIGKAVRPINDAGMPTKPLLGAGFVSLGLRCSRVSCQYASPCCACVTASQRASIESNFMPPVVAGAPLNCSFDPESQGWHSDGILANLQREGPQQLVSRESSDSGVLQWTVRFDPENLPVEVGVVPHDKVFVQDYLWSHGGIAVTSASSRSQMSRHRENFQGVLVQVRCDIDSKTVSWRKGPSPDRLVEFHKDSFPRELQGKVRLCISCASPSEAGFPCVHLASNPGYGMPEVCCKKGHVLTPLGTTRDNGWSCDGTSDPSGCKRGLQLVGGRTLGISRFRCDACDFDYCDACYTAAVQEIAKKHSQGPGNATAPAAFSFSQREEVLTSSKLQLSEKLWGHAALVATWLLRDLPHADASADVKRLCSETLADWLAIAANFALAEADDADGKIMSDSVLFSGPLVFETELQQLCGFEIQPPSNSTWASWRNSMSEAVSSSAPLSKAQALGTHSSAGGQRCGICARMCQALLSTDASLHCNSCGRRGINWKCSSCAGWGVCKDCGLWPDGQTVTPGPSTPDLHGFSAAMDIGEVGLISRMPPPLLTELCVQCPDELSSALAAGEAWPLLRHVIKHESAGRGDDHSLWAKLVVAAVSGAALEAECLSDLLGALLAVKRPVQWPKGSGLGPDLRSARWLFEAMMQKQTYLPSGRVLLAVVKTLQHVPDMSQYGGVGTRIGLCQALARAPLGALTASEADVIAEESFQLLEMLATEGTPASASCLTNVAAALQALVSCRGHVSAFAKPRPVAIVTALAFCQARRSLYDNETEAAGQKPDPSEPVLPSSLLRRFLQLPDLEETLQIKLSASDAVLLQVPTAASFEVFASVDDSSAVQRMRLAAVGTADQENGNPVLGEVELSSEPKSLGIYEGRDVILGVILPLDSKQNSSSHKKEDNAMQKALPTAPDSNIQRDAFGRPMDEFGRPLAELAQGHSLFVNPVLSPDVHMIDGKKMTVTVQDSSFEESRWEHYRESQLKGAAEEQQESVPSKEELPFRWASISEGVPDGWRIALRSDVGRLPAAATEALTVADVRQGPFRLQSPWVLELAGEPVAPAWRRADDDGDEWDLLEGQLLTKVEAFKDSCFPRHPLESPSSIPDGPSSSPLMNEHRAFIDVPVRSGISLAASSMQQLPAGVTEVVLGDLEEAPAAVTGQWQADLGSGGAGNTTQEGTSKATTPVGELRVLHGELWFSGSKSENIFAGSTAFTMAGFPSCELKSGRWVYEVEMLEEPTADSPIKIGWMSSAAPSSLQALGTSEGSWAVALPRSTQSSILSNVVVKEEVQHSASSFVGVAVDMTTKEMWFAIDGNWALCPDFPAFKIEQKSEKLGPWEIQTDAGWRSFRPGVFFHGRAGEGLNYSHSGHRYRAVFSSDRSGTQTNLTTQAVRSLRRRPPQDSESSSSAHLFPAISGRARCVFHTSSSTIKYPPPAKMACRPIEEWAPQGAVSKTVGRCYQNESPALPFRFEVEVMDLSREGDAAAVGVAWGTWMGMAPAAQAASSSPLSSIFGPSSSVSAVFGQVPASASSGSLFGAPQPASSGSLFGASSGSLFGGSVQTSGSLFGGSGSNPPVNTSGNLFGAPAFGAAPVNTSGNLFGAPAFGAASLSTGPAGGSLFGSAPSATGGAISFGGSQIFGLPVSASTSSGLFGSASASVSMGSLFGAPASNTSAAGGLFGASASTSGPPAMSSPPIFGAAAITASANIFGTASTSSLNIFGQAGGSASGVSSSIAGLVSAADAGTSDSSTVGSASGGSSGSAGLFGAAPAGDSGSGGSFMGNAQLFGAAPAGAAESSTAGGSASGGSSGSAGISGAALAGASDSSTAGGLFGSTAPQQSSGGATDSTPSVANAENSDARWHQPGSISWLWHSDGRLECAAAPWSHKAGICTSDTGQKYAAGDLVAVEFLPLVPALLFCKNGAPAFALHMVEGYGDEAKGEELQRLRTNSRDVALPIPGLFAGAQPAVRLPKDGTVSLGQFSIDGQDVSNAKWSQEHLDPCQRQVRMPAFAAASELVGISSPVESLLPPACVESCGYGVRVRPLQSEQGDARQTVKLFIRSTPRDPTFLEKVLAAWVESQREQLAGKQTEEEAKEAADKTSGYEAQEVVEPHRFYSKRCMVCIECLSCTGYGNKCVRNQDPKRVAGADCGCGFADDTHNSGCEVCGRCQACAAKSLCKPRRRRDATAFVEPSSAVSQAVATIQQCMEASAEVAISAVAPLFDEPVLSASSREERVRWHGLGTMLPQARRRERWTAALSTGDSAGAGFNYTARLKRRAAAKTSTPDKAPEALSVPVWEQLAMHVVGFNSKALQSNTNPFNVTFVGEENIMDRSIRRCPRCGRLLQKSDGCDSMACCMYGSDGCRGARCDHGGGCGHRFDWNQTLVLGPFQEALEAFSADFMASDLLTDCPNRRSRDGPNQDTRLPHPHPALGGSDPTRWRTLLQGVGRMMGVAARVQLPLRLALNPLGWSWLHAGGHDGLELRQLTESDQQASQMVRYLRSISSAEELAELGEDVEFAAENVAGELVQLDTPGRTVLSIDDAHDLADCLERLHLVEGLEPLASVATGMASVLPLGMMRLLLDAPTLEEAVCGATDVNLAELREHTELVTPDEGPSSTDAPKSNSTEPVLDWLFQALEGFTPSERRGFVRLISGNRRLPEHGEWRMRVRVDKPEDQGGSALPTARECAMLLTVPPCKGASDLAQRLRVTIASSDAQMIS